MCSAEGDLHAAVVTLQTLRVRFFRLTGPRGDYLLQSVAHVALITQHMRALEAKLPRAPRLARAAAVISSPVSGAPNGCVCKAIEVWRATVHDPEVEVGEEVAEGVPHKLREASACGRRSDGRERIVQICEHGVQGRRHAAKEPHSRMSVKRMQATHAHCNGARRQRGHPSRRAEGARGRGKRGAWSEPGVVTTRPGGSLVTFAPAVLGLHIGHRVFH